AGGGGRIIKMISAVVVVVCGYRRDDSKVVAAGATLHLVISGHRRDGVGPGDEDGAGRRHFGGEGQAGEGQGGTGHTTATVERRAAIDKAGCAAMGVAGHGAVITTDGIGLYGEGGAPSLEVIGIRLQVIIAVADLQQGII